MKKVSVMVDEEKLPVGIVIPKVIHWPDGRIFKVSRVLYHTTSPTHEFDGVRYTVIIDNAEKYIYRANRKWYVMVSSGGGP